MGEQTAEWFNPIKNIYSDSTYVWLINSTTPAFHELGLARELGITTLSFWNISLGKDAYIPLADQCISPKAMGRSGHSVTPYFLPPGNIEGAGRDSE